MKYSTIRIEGAILSADILDKIRREELSGQSAKDFGLPVNTKVKDEIARAWADAQDMWRVYKRRIDRLAENDYGTSETRKFWIIPLLEMLGFDTVYSKSETLNGKSYAISHRANNLDQFPVHIMGFRDSLDKKRTDSGPRMSPHGLVQEYLNLTEHLYAVVTNGVYLRLLRDSSRLIKLSFIEFDLASMMEDEHFADFAIMYRILHASRMPQKTDAGANSLIEQYHQDALDSGSRIRNGLSQAVETSIRMLGEGFLAHQDNEQLRTHVTANKLNADELYEYLLKLIYRLLFLMVIEERDLVYPKGCNKEKRQIYYSYYSLASLRSISEKPHLADKRFSDLWIKLKNCFVLFDRGNKGEKLDLKPLAGDLFGRKAIGILNSCSLDNKTLLTCLRNLNIFENPVTRQKMRVNYGSLNVEEFGSVYEGLLEKDPVLQLDHGEFAFGFKAGSERSSSGSHYTPDELVQPLIKHSLDHIISDRLKSPDPIAALLSIKVCDVACGSGHILLNAARRIGAEVAKLRSGEEQPSPQPFRQGVRDAISHCIYGVDKNPLAVELCKVALWLEAHDLGKPLSFLDHHIKCGDAIVGLARKDELENGISDDAFIIQEEDDKDVAKRLRNQNKREKQDEAARQSTIHVFKENAFVDLAEQYRELDQISQETSDDVELVKATYEDLVAGTERLRLKALADIQVAQFFIPKTEGNEGLCTTHREYNLYLSGQKTIQSHATTHAIAMSNEKRFFHWFLEFPEIFEEDGFDCILGNPPFLGGQKLSGSFGHYFLNYVKQTYSPIKSVDIVTYFFRRIFSIIKPGGFQALLSTNTISQGNAREGGLAVIMETGGAINFAVPSMRWPGQAAVEIAIVILYKGNWNKPAILNSKIVSQITSYLDDSQDLGDPHPLLQNEDKSFQGSIVLGQGFILRPEEAAHLIEKNPKNRDVLFPYLNGQDLNGQPDQSPRRWVINFFDWNEEYCKNNYSDCFEIVKNTVRPFRAENNRKVYREKWWIYGERRPGLYSSISSLDNILVTAQVSKTLAFSFTKNDKVLDAKLIVFALSTQDCFAILQSSLHYNWAWKYCTTMKADLSYTPGTIFQTFPFPQNIRPETKAALTTVGERYHEFRHQLMYCLQLGLTKTYNLFHNPDLTLALVLAACKRTANEVGQAFEDILALRKLHLQMDNVVLAAYGWADIDLAHDFYDMDYLPEHDRTRYTISPEARKEILKRLLKLNHDLYSEEQSESLPDKKIGTSKKMKAAIKKGQPIPGNLFE